MRNKMIAFLTVTYLVTVQISKAEFLNEPRLQTIDGHLYVYGARDKNISLMVSSKGYLNVNGENLFKVVKDAKKASNSIFSLEYTSLTKLEEDLKYVTLSVDQMTQRLNVCESLISNLQTSSGNGGPLPLQFQMKVNKLERRVKSILRNLARRECQKDPCMNGGTCSDKYLDYECKCLEGWEGRVCERDVNECARFAGSDLGCQNGATCINKPGTYECVCASGWYGLHCTRRSNDCTSGPQSELCGHGTCVTQTVGTKGFTCICDQGWKTDGVNPSCSVDVDECSTYPCSRNPLVTCHNTPGNFFCGPCPPGYTGNGFSCTDVNECLIENGGCSVQPLVQCINTDGSSTCGPCPPGYVGDGKTCTFVGKCQVDNGGCNANARCQEIGSNIQCQCVPGYTGSGIGPFGCELIGSGVVRNPCSPNPCKHSGWCYLVSESNFTCMCTAGYTGPTCDTPTNPCNSNPCQNGGTCIFRRIYKTFICRCTSSYSGKYCQRERQSCGGYMNADEGELQFPSANSSSIRYSHNLNCAWIIIVNSSLVINATFDYFDLESAPECQMDWVQIHDGKSAGDHIIGKFCGKDLPNNGTIVSSTNYMYMWFKSDGSKSGSGFKLTWKAVNPVCGGVVNASIHGTIRSPGSPGKYPPNRDCLWQVTAPLGKRIAFTFFEVYIESHENCMYDFLEFHEGLTLDSPLLARYCNTTIPQPLTTPGNTALVYFHSDQFQSDRGFQIAYHPVPGYPGCGGIYTTRRGQITPPMEDGRYIKNMDCAWLIKLTGNLRIKIQFSFFRLEDEQNCNTDFVEIREGSDITAPLIARYCGYTLPPVIESEGNVLFVRFYTDNTIESSGFSLSYRAVCSQIYTAETGVIQSPGYPNKYRTQEDCVFVIEQPPGKIIQLEFQDFEFELVTVCLYDYIEIRDGANERSPLIKRYCGNDRPPLITSTHNYLWIKMVTDKDVEMRGFYANYTTVDIACGGIFTAPEGEIRSPTEYGAYPANQNCRWVIAGKPGEIVQLTFTTFKVEYHNRCEFDFVAVYDNSSTAKGDGLMGRFCGESVPPLLTTAESTMTIHFHSDTSLALDGFTATYRLVNTSTFCGGNYFTNTGVIKSPNYPRPYPNAKTCVWVIRVTNGNKIALNVVNFALERTLGPNQVCSFDFLEIRDGGYESSPLIGRYCGTKIPKRIVSQSNLLYLKFTSDNTFPNMGFHINWDGSITGCGGTLTSVTGSIISPNYPEPYGENSLCIYKISVAMGSKVTLNFMDLDLENFGSCSMDFIEIFDGPEDAGKSLGKFCSATNHPAFLTSNQSEVTIKFRSDVRNAGKGFYLKYKTECNTELRGFRGVIESPNFPEKFPQGTNCTWVIAASSGNKINISFSDFNFNGPCEDDYIEILEGSPRPTNTIGKYCRGKKPPLIASSLDRVYVKLTSSPSSFRGSFRAEWALNGCGGTFIKPQGEFKSPNYPNVYPPNTVCEYYIRVDPLMSVVLTITDINFEALKECFGDALEVYGGADRSAPLLAKLCQRNSQPVVIETTGNEMFVRFKSDQITGGSGFFARYSTKPAACGGQRISNEGYITSRNYPKNYNQMDSCLWTIQVDSNHKIKLTFDDFDLESVPSCSATYVQVFDGPTRDYPLILKHCGNTLPSPNPIHSTSNSLTLYMRSDVGYTAKGFKVHYEMSCGAVLTANEPGVISSSDYLLTRADHDNCTWTIVSPQPDGHVTLTVSYMDPSSDDDCSDNSLYAYDGGDHNATLLGAYCGRQTHLPVVTRGNVLFLEFIQSTYNSVHFWATYSSTTSACGGNLYGETGSFATPGYPSSYPSKSECIWFLQAAPGNKYQINFKEFDLGESDHCNEDYVEIREKDSAGKLLGIYCGQTAPTNLTTQSLAWIKFRSGKIGTGKKGFLADYNLVYKNEVNGSSGEIANPFYPRAFMHYVDGVKWRVTVDFGSAIRIRFKEVHLDDFHTVMCISYVTIYDGYDETAPELLKVCGMVKPEVVTSSSNVVFIVFSHSQVQHGSSFLLEWTMVSKPGSPIQPTAASTSKCKREFDWSSSGNNSITLTNPDWPDPYVGNLECEWILQCPDYEHLTLTINLLVVAQYSQCLYSYLGVSSKSVDDDWTQLRRFCLNNETDQRISATNFMKVTFVSNYNERSLFSASVERECGNSIKKPNGVIKFHWRNYTSKGWSPENAFCHWDITVSPGKKIKVYFSEFDFSQTTDHTCTEKYLMLRNGGSDESPLLGEGVYCSFPSLIPLTTSNRLYIKAKTSYQGTSFVMKFEEVSPNCGRRIKLDDNFNVTIISSPNYPNIPPSKIECVWTFSTTGSHRIQIDFIDRFDLTVSRSCDEEYVEVRDGGTLLSEEIGRFCSDKPNTQKSSGNMLFVKYYTNSTNPKNGFKAQVAIARCGGTIRSSSGVVTSPGYPNSYPYDVDCVWSIETDVRYKLQVTFEDINLPTNNSTLPASPTTGGSKNAWRTWTENNANATNCTSSGAIYLEEPGLTPLLQKYPLYAEAYKLLMRSRTILLGSICNNEPVTPIRAYRNKIIIRFQGGPTYPSYLNTPFRGFKLNFTSVGKGCVHRLDTPSGVITSPGYPNESPNFYYCTWKITVPKGRRITLRVNDFDLPNSAVEQRVLLYNEHRYRSRIALLTGAVEVDSVYTSTSNLMLITFWSKRLTGSGRRGFKFTYDSDEPQICGGLLSDEEGFLTSPTNLSSFYCKWEFQAKRSENQTLAFYVKDAYIGNRTGTCSIKYGAVLAISGRGRSNYFQEEICGNITSYTVRNPVPYAFVTAIQGIWSGAVIFNVTYKTFPCGGTIYDPEGIITTPSYPNNYAPDTDCAWLIYLSPGQIIKLNFEEFNLQPSCDDFLLVKNGPSPKSPLIGQYCGTSVSGMSPITSEESSLFLEFHSDSTNQGKGFKLSIEPGSYVCGGAVHSPEYELMSPNFPSEYDNNQECEWEIRSAEGTHIGLVFVDRFHIESSENCKNDFVKVYDYVKNDWKLLKTLCGREMPSAINSTSSRMKVLFRSNGATVSDGFKAKWYQNCGGHFASTKGTILSPGYPNTYKSNLNCTYIIENQEKNTKIDFTDFNIEPALNGRCQYDSVKIYEADWQQNFDLVGIFCGSKAPSPRILRGTVKIEFVTDSNNNYGGFAINFKSSKCGGHVNETSILEYYVEPPAESYSEFRECVWEIVAPPEKIVTIKFDNVNMPFTTECSYPYIDVFDERKNESFLMGRICGRLKAKQVVMKSTTNKMTVKLQKPYYEGEGFTAGVYFTYGSSVGCGGEIELDSSSKTIKSPDVDGDGFYEEFLDCTWIVRAKPFHQIVATFKSFDVQDCRKINEIVSNATETCACDYVDVRDGADRFSEYLLQTCGSVLPSPVTSSGSVLSIQLSSDGTYHGRGFNVELSSILSECGIQILNPQDTVQSLTSPNYPQNYPEGLRCKWTIYDPSADSKRIIHLHVTEWDIADSYDCKEDFIYIEDTGYFKPLYQSPTYEMSPNRSANTAEIIRGSPTSMYFYDNSQSKGKIKLCGKGKSVDYYSASNEVSVGFFSNSGSSANRKGFQIEYSLAGCTRNYTAEQGHIKNLNFKNDSHCYISITAPTPNHTISLYFTSFTLKGNTHGDCPVSFLEVRDGPGVKSPLLGKFCGYANPSPIFSSGQNLWLHLYTRLSTYTHDYQNLDITYTTTDKGRGCGGRLFGMSGTVSSPGYPSNVRKNSLCRWDIVIPSGLEEAIQFSVFDIGPSNTCNTDYIEFYEVIGDTGTETLLSRFCGKDNPAVIRSTADVLVIKYATSLHNGGTGWQLEYRAVTPGIKIF